MATRKRSTEKSKASSQPNLLIDLNDQQRQAVTHKSGPLLVVAGAGTGKTKVLTHRVAWLIEEGIAKPSEILALTFTDKAAGEMESRVDQILPYGQTQTTIATFHAFGDALLREYALDLGLPPEFSVLGSDEQAIFLADRFDEIEDLTELRPIGNPRKFLAPILSVISRAKDELVSPNRYHEVAFRLQQQASDEDEAREARRQLDLAKIYRAYEEFKAQKGVIDFGDQILMLVRFLDTNPKVRSRLQDQFKFILVDEFQDTNIAQYELVKRLLDSTSSNLTVVGDDDQAIYKFRGAAVSNILGFLSDFPVAERVVLTQNYRSNQGILDTAYQLIRHNDPDRLENKLEINKKLEAQEQGSRPLFHWYTHETDELVGLTQQIERLRSTQALNSIAVLVRSNNLVDAVAGALTTVGIPYSASKDQHFPDRPEVRGIVAFLRALVHTDDALSHVKLALSPYYRLTPEWILPFNDAARRARRSIHDVLHDEGSVAWKRVPEAGRITLASFRDDLVQYRAMIGTKNPGEILYQFLRDRGILDRSQSNDPQRSLFGDIPEQEQLAMVQNVAAVFEAIMGYLEAGRDPFALAFVDYLNELLVTIVPPSVNLGPDVDAVRIMTVHAAKGLEFDTVFLPSLVGDRFPARRRSEPLQLPDQLITEQLPSGDEHLQEERRLMYVAMTRAKRQLILSGAERVGSGTRVKKLSPFVIEALGLSRPPAPISLVSPAARLHHFAPSVPVPATIQLPTYDGLLFLSPAAIETYQQDPYNFYWKYVLKAPQEPSRHLVYGNAIHSAIEAYYRLRKEGKEPELDDLVRRYSEAWVSEGFDSKAHENRQFEHGQETLRQFLTRAESEPVPELVEHSFKLTLPGVKISGRMDAVFTSAHEIRDFKTSQVKDQKDADRKARENLPIRIYALAYQQQFGQLPKRAVLDFVEHDLKGVVKPDEAVLESTKQLIAETVANIKAGKFEPNPENPFRDYD